MRVAFSTLGRISVENIQRALSHVVTLRQQVATGRKFEIASQDPIGAQRAVGYGNELVALGGYKDAANDGMMFIESAESVLFGIGEQLREAKSIALSQINANADSSSRETTAVAIRSIRDEVMALLNSEVRGRYLFAGHRTTTKPFVLDATGAVQYLGDDGQIVYRVGPNQREIVNVPGSAVAGTSDSFLRSSVDLSPILSGATALASLNRGSGVAAGRFQIEDGSGNAAVIDTTGLSTVQDVLDQINAAGIGVVAQVNAQQNGIDLQAVNPGDTVTVTELDGGTAASQLGIEGSSVGMLRGADIDPALELNTALADIPTLTSLPLGSIRVVTGGVTYLPSFAGPPPAATIADIINRFHAMVPELNMTISVDGQTLEISGYMPFTVEDHPPDTTATQLGIAGVASQSRLFGSLEDMERALLADDVEALESSLFELQRVMTNLVRVQGVVASRAERLDAGLELLDTHQLKVETRLSDVRSTDMAEAITELTEAQTLYQTALGTAASVFDLSLFDYIYP